MLGTAQLFHAYRNAVQRTDHLQILRLQLNFVESQRSVRQNRGSASAALRRFFTKERGEDHGHLQLLGPQYYLQTRQCLTQQLLLAAPLLVSR